MAFMSSTKNENSAIEMQQLQGISGTLVNTQKFFM
jgi:hypothetical protein